MKVNLFKNSMTTLKSKKMQGVFNLGELNTEGSHLMRLLGPEKSRISQKMHYENDRINKINQCIKITLGKFLVMVLKNRSNKICTNEIHIWQEPSVLQLFIYWIVSGFDC